MDPLDNSSIKKQRNSKIRTDKRKNTYSKPRSVNDDSKPNPKLVQNSEFKLQPQTTNNHHRHEPTSKNVATEQTSKVMSQEVNENNMIDHSNLKRETEEIKKLTTKYSKREVTSNWHRYAVDGSVPSAEQSEGDAPADFTALLQVPVSRGGHLQLKEEQEWSSVIPKGHWALDLKQLSFSLACIPTHERLRLPIEKLSEEEAQKYVFLAEEAKKYYEACEETELQDDTGYREKPFNILDIENSTNTLLNMDLDLDQVVSVSELNTSEGDSNVINRVKLVTVVKQDVKIHENKQELSSICDCLANCKPLDGSNNKLNLSNSLSIEAGYCEPKVEVTQQPNTINNEPKQKDQLPSQQLVVDNPPALKLQTSSQQLTSDNHPAPKLPTPSQQQICDNQRTQNYQPNSHAKIPDSGRDNLSKTVVECHTDQTNNNEIKEQRTKRFNRNLPLKEEAESNKTLEELNETKLDDDDDDLDFLLSLKKPISSEKINSSKPAALQDSSFLPGALTVSSSTTPAQHTDLDDWLDSVLED